MPGIDNQLNYFTHVRLVNLKVWNSLCTTLSTSVPFIHASRGRSVCPFQNRATPSDHSAELVTKSSSLWSSLALLFKVPTLFSEHSAELVKSQVRRVSLWSCLALLLERGYLHPLIIIIILCFYPDNGRAVGHHVEAERDSSPPPYDGTAELRTPDNSTPCHFKDTARALSLHNLGYRRRSPIHLRHSSGI